MSAVVKQTRDFSDPDYHAWNDGRSRNRMVYLNGEEINNVREAHVREGWLVKTAKDADGNLVLNEARDEFVVETLTGSVQVVLNGEVL